MLNALIVYHQKEYPPRATIREHLYSFRRDGRFRCFYVNVAAGAIPQAIARSRYDIIIYHTTFLSTRWSLPIFRTAVERVEALRNAPGYKIALPQDEFIHTQSLSQFLIDFGVHSVLSVAPSTEWGKIYPQLEEQGIRFDRVLTGYLEPSTVERLSRWSGPRTIDIGYRAWRSAPWLGRHGLPKAEIAELFKWVAPPGLHLDISTRHEDTLLGNEWYRFLSRCRYVIGVEGGASLLDADGSIKERTEAFLSQNPDATFEEVEAACFPGLDGSLQLAAISPRHFEACATRTCQILVEGEYNGILRPWEHYIELQRDYSNIEEVMELVDDDRLREELTENAYRDVVASGIYTYRSLPEAVLRNAAAAGVKTEPVSKSPAANPLLQQYDRWTWTKVAVFDRVVLPAGRRVRSLAPELVDQVRAAFRARQRAI